MPLDIKQFDVGVMRADYDDADKALQDGEGVGYDIHRVWMLQPDIIRAEQAGPKYGLTDDAKSAYGTLVIWCALKRMRIDVPEFPLFKYRVLDMSLVAPAPGEVTPADPTQPAPGTG